MFMISSGLYYVTANNWVRKAAVLIYIGYADTVEDKWSKMASFGKSGCSYPSRGDDRVPRQTDQEESPHSHQILLTKAVIGYCCMRVEGNYQVTKQSGLLMEVIKAKANFSATLLNR